MIRVGHKGADLLVPGNTLKSFEKAVEVGVDIVELDVLWVEQVDDVSEADLDAAEVPLVVAHDRRAAEVAERLTLDDALAAFTQPPLDRVLIDLDIKLAGREEDLVEAVRRHGLVERAMVSTMETESLRRVEELEPGIRRGWTVPRVSRDWSSNKYVRPVLGMAVGLMRRRLPNIAAARLATLDVSYMWVFHRLLSRRLLEVAHDADVQVMAWTVDSRSRIEELKGLGVDGIVSNDPRLLNPASGSTDAA